MRKLNSLTFAILAGFSVQSVNAAELMSVDQSSAIKGKYIVVFKTPQVLNMQSSESIASYANMQAASLSNNYNVNIAKQFNGILNGVLVNASNKQVQDMLTNPNIDYIEQDQIISVNPIAQTSSNQVAVNQVNANQANAIWGLDRIDQVNLPLNSTYNHDYDGTGVTAYVIDSGVRISHDEFGNRASHGYDFVDNDNDASDCNGHGTHVAGTIGGITYGVAKNVNIVSVRVLDCNSSGSMSNVIAGINWVKNNASGPSVVNYSIGGNPSQVIDDAVNSIVAAGIPFVTSAGNDFKDACTKSPARAVSAITVGSTASDDVRSSFSNFGSCLDIYAPGSDIKSAGHNSNTSTATMQGTSMAAPHVAGAVALYLDENPSLSPSQIDSILSQRSSKDKVINAQPGSPNKLLNTLGGGGPTDPIDPPTGGNVLQNGVAKTNLSASTGADIVFTMDVPAGATNINFVTSGGTGDVDMYVKFGSAPTDTSFDCRPYAPGNSESCSGTSTAGTYYVRLKAYQAFSGVSLTGSYTGGGTPPPGGGNPPIAEQVTNVSVGAGQWKRYSKVLPAGYSTMTVSIHGGSGDADLYVRRGAQSTSSNYDCRPYETGNIESCSFTTPAAGTWHIDIYGYQSTSGLTLNLQANP